MFSKVFLTTTLITSALATVATAQDGTYRGYGTTYTSLSANGESLDILSAYAGFDTKIEQVLITGSLSYANFSAASEDIQLSAVDVKFGYDISPNLVAHLGLYSQSLEGETFSQWSLGGEYVAGGATFGLAYAQDEDSNSGTSLYGGYQFAPSTEVGLSISQSDDANTGDVYTLTAEHDTGMLEIEGLAMFADDADAHFIGGSATYELNGPMRIAGSIGAFQIGSDDITIFSVGGGYEIADNTWIDASVGQISADGIGDKITTFGIGISFDVGRRTLLADRMGDVQDTVLGDLLSLGF